MTAEQKLAIAQLLDIYTDYLRDGYKLDRTYAFTDDAEVPPGADKPSETGELPAAAIADSCGKADTGVSMIDSPHRIAADVRQCTACPRRHQGDPPTPGAGSWRPQVLILGDRPEPMDGETGVPMPGPEGELLDRMLASIDLSREKNCYVTTLVKCPGQGNPPLPEEQAACAPLLLRELAVLKPRLILKLSRSVQELLDNHEVSVENRAEFPMTHPDFPDIPVLTTFHPGAILMDGSLKRPAWEDLKRLRARLTEPNGDQEPF